MNQTFKNLRSKLTLFDVILFGLLTGLTIFFFIFFYRRAEYIPIQVKVTDQDILYAQYLPNNWYANQFRTGDVEKDTIGRIITEVKNVHSFSTDANEKAVYLDLIVRATYDQRTQTYTVRGKKLIFGAPMRFNLDTITFDGYVTKYPGSTEALEPLTGTATVIALERDIEPSLAESIQIGDQIVDSTGEVLAEVINVAVTPAEQVTATDDGDLLLRHNPLYKDITVTVQIKTVTLQNEPFVFDNLPLKIGEELPLNFETGSIFPLIAAFELNQPTTNK